MDEPRETAKILRRAAEIVEQGWCKGLYWDSEVSGVSFEHARPGQSSFCAMGAIVTAIREYLGDEAFAGSRDMFGAIMNRNECMNASDALNVGNVPDWNDGVAKSAEEVATRMREVANGLDA